MKTYSLFLGLMFLVGTAFGAGQELRRAEGQLSVDCKSITNGTALELFNVSVTTALRADMKFLLLASEDVTYATNTVRISSFAATADDQGFPMVGYASPPLKLEVGQNTRIFVRKGTNNQPASRVCGAAFK